ncbi:MAG: ORF6N domain-containing protein [Chitinophagaceae bacterium]|nr:ORF6N domain-containing protein [Chitinophagaceae bacterium]
MKIIPDETIIRKIYVLRGQKVMLDYDIAALYEVATKVLNQSVKRNAERFPEDFMFRLTAKEWQNMRSQFVTASSEIIDLQKTKTMRSQIATASQNKRNAGVTPYAFTEHGITMLATVLRSEKAVKMSIAVVRAFIELKRIAVNYAEIAKQLDLLKDRIGEHDVQLGAIYDAIENLMDEKVEEKVKNKTWEQRERIGFKK